MFGFVIKYMALVRKIVCSFESVNLTQDKKETVNKRTIILFTVSSCLSSKQFGVKFFKAPQRIA